MVKTVMLKHSCSDDLEWSNCYGPEAKFGRFFDKETLKHPAKMSFHLLERIFQHLEQKNFIDSGTTIVDFMSGTGRTGLIAALRGYSAWNVELEQEYIKMQRKNKAKLEQTIGPTNINIMPGDARNLFAIGWNSGYNQKKLTGIISPPYENAEIPQFDSDLRKALHSDKGKRSVKEMQKKRAELRATEGWEGYNVSNLNNVGNLKKNDYRNSMIRIYSQACALKISPLVIVTKNPTRNGKLIDLAENTASYLKMAGYKIVDYHRSRLFNKVKTETSGLFPNSEEKIKGRVSFFKRLSIEKGNVAAEWEDIIFASLT
jgi:16S rRNA G966 N2-methylase RsmD